MYLNYIQTTAKHYVFEVVMFGGQWEFSPAAVYAGIMVKPTKVDLPQLIPAGSVIGSLTVPSPGVFLDFAEYSPIFQKPDTLKDFYDLFNIGEKDLIDMVHTIVCRELRAYYLIPEEEPETQPEYPYSDTDSSGWTYLLPYEISESGSAAGDWVAANEYVEGMVLHLPYLGLLFSLQNDLSDGRFDGRYLCLYGGGYYPLIPRFGVYPTLYGAQTNFVISSLDTWDGIYGHGYGNTSSERTRLAIEGYQYPGGFTLRNRYSEVAGFPFFGSTVYADEYITIYYYELDNPSPGLPRIIPPEYEEQDSNGMGFVFSALQSLTDTGLFRTLEKMLSPRIITPVTVQGEPFEVDGEPFLT